ncbi:MAG: FAD-dependent oxidoreductase [Bacillus sp. (in: Bacteria)]|nr:FAD-dependent oxidoreductase [Bacillus sp. (in: firmicutes)]
MIIIGAGLSGLFAAKKLTDKGLNVLVLEGRTRLGGRILSIPHEGGVLELGAQWIAPTHHRVKSLVAEAGLTFTPTYTKGKTLCYQMNGGAEVQTDPFSLLTKLELFRFKRKLEKLSATIPKESPWEAEGAQELDSQTVESFCHQMIGTSVGKTFIRRKLEELLCNELTEISLLDLLWCIGTAGSINAVLAGEKYWLKEGTQGLIIYLAGALPENCLELGIKVEKIDWGNDGVTVYGNGQLFAAKKLIITLPPRLCSDIAYDPPLPAMRDQFTQQNDQSSVIKCLVVYDCPFWRMKGYSGTSYKGEGPVHMTIDSSINDRLGVLTVIIAGQEARTFGALTEVERREIVIATLIRVFGDEARTPLRYLDKNWSEDPFSRGGYGAHFPPGVITQFQDVLFRPIGPLHFAGSETATEWRLYMEGALVSAERVVDEITTESSSKGYR